MQLVKTSNNCYENFSMLCKLVLLINSSIVHPSQNTFNTTVNESRRVYDQTFQDFNFFLSFAIHVWTLAPGSQPMYVRKFELIELINCCMLTAFYEFYEFQLHLKCSVINEVH